MTRHLMRPLAVLATVGLVLTGCGSSSDDTGATAAPTGGVTTEAGAGTTGTTQATTASSASSATSPTTEDPGVTTDDSAATVIEATVAGGEVTTADDRFEVAKGTDVVIRVTTDVAEPVHLHGYDIEAEAAPGKPVEITFTASIPGVFEVELEDSGTLLFEIEVK